MIFKTHAAGFGVIGVSLGILWCVGCSKSSTADRSSVVDLESTEIHLEDVTNESGLDFTFENGAEEPQFTLLEWVGGGVALRDFDLDGIADVFVVGGGSLKGRQVGSGSNGLFRGLGNLKFEDVSRDCRVSRAVSYSCGCSAADFDNDGFQDLLITGFDALMLLKNQGDGTFLDVTNVAGLGNDQLWSTSAAWADFDNDGTLDIYVCHYLDWSFDNHPFCVAKSGGRNPCAPKRFSGLPDSLFIAKGDGAFVEVSTNCGILRDGKGLGVVCADLDADRDVDIYVANDTTENRCYLNDGHASFTEVGVPLGVSGDEVGAPNGSMGVDVGDFDADGKLDVWVANYVEEPFALYKNLGDAGFLHYSNAAGINAIGNVYVGFGTGLIDIDCDADLDIIAINGHVLNEPPSAPLKQKPLVLRNDQFRFKSVKAGDYTDQPHIGRGLAWGDLDGDGDQDFVASHIAEPVKVLRNDTNDHHWLDLRLVGTLSNRDAVGTKVFVTTRKRTHLVSVNGGASYLSSPLNRVLFSIGTDDEVMKLEVHWPSGQQTLLSTNAISQPITILEGY